MEIVEKFIPHKPLETAVLFIVFNRPHTTRLVFQEIRKAKPPRLYIAADGPRESYPADFEKVKEVREYIMSNIDWECEVKTLFREKNLGCKLAPAEAITWFFENEEMGIILEDDCLPSQSFFWFCEELLNRYKDDMRVWHIGGFTLQQNMVEFSYRFSRLVPIWGWASWSRAWVNYEFGMESFDINQNDIYVYFGKYKNHVKRTFHEFILYNIDAWDIQWAYTCVKNKALTIIPRVSLIRNIGFGSDATHTKSYDKKVAQISNNDLSFPLIHPDPNDLSYVEILDEKYLSIFYRTSLLSKVKRLIKGLLLER